MSINTGLFSSASCEWSTPQYLFDELNQRYCFTLDPCATKENAKCSMYFTKEDDGLQQKWSGRVFMNPPYGRDIGMWIRKAYDSVKNNDAELVVCLLPSRTDTKWFHEYCLKGEITYIRGRLKFGNSKVSAPFPSIIVVFKKPATDEPEDWAKYYDKE